MSSRRGCTGWHRCKRAKRKRARRWRGSTRSIRNIAPAFARRLKLHRGRGYFLPPETIEKWRSHIRGEASDTYAAFRSLQILGALDLVKDLPDWGFRFSRTKPKKEAADGLSWAELQPWVLKDRFERER